MKIPFIINADMDCLLERIDTCHNSPKKSSATKINKYALSGYSSFTHCSFDATIIISLIIVEVKTVWKSFVKI